MVCKIITGNILAALISPILLRVRWITNVFRALFYGEYEYYDFRINSLKEFLFAVYGNGYLIESLVIGLIIFLPFQLIKNYYVSQGNPLPFIKKLLLMSGIVIVIILTFGTFTNIWWTPWYYNIIYLVFAFGFGLFYSYFLYIMVDRYQEKHLPENR